MQGLKHFGAPAAIYILIDRSLYFQKDGINVWPLFDCGSVAENINISCRRHGLAGGVFLRHGQEAQRADDFIRKLRIKTSNREQEIRLLSGGNQQKVILARWLAEPGLKVLILDEPTRGIDVGAKNEIYRIIHEVAESGACVIVVSSELPEVLGIADRVSPYSYQRAGRVYLEEDCDMPLYLDAAKAAGWRVTFTEKHEDPTPIREFSRFEL